MFGIIKNFFTRVAELTSSIFEDSEIIEEQQNKSANGFLHSKVIDEEPKIKKLKRSFKPLQ